MLQEFGCTLGQGWLIARPMPGDDLIGWMKQYRVQAAQLRG
jgi:EAL domain-containing protein (putative c-di-GMP-specific phosphodiesterase class I)